MMTEPLATEGRHQCDNGEWEGEAEALRPIRSLESRLDPGGIVPSGECPEGGALAYPVKRTRWLDGVEGGLEVTNIYGPVQDEAHQSEILLQAMRENHRRLAPEESDTIQWIEVYGTTEPEFGSFSGGDIDNLREQVEQEER